MSSNQYPEEIEQEMRELTERGRQAAARGDVAEVRQLGERFQVLREQTRNGGATNRSGGRYRHGEFEAPTHDRTPVVYGNILGDLHNMDARLGADIRALEQIRNVLPRDRSRGGAQDRYGGLLPPTYGTRRQSHASTSYRPRSGRVEIRFRERAALPQTRRGPFPLVPQFESRVGQVLPRDTFGNRVDRGRRHYDYDEDEEGDEESGDDYGDEDDDEYY